jgi:hypothetical protein
MDPIASTTSAGGSVPAPTKTPKADPAAKLTAFEDKLKAAGATLEKVSGHAYERVRGGKHDGKLLNASGNARSGQLFEIVHRDGRTYHVYGSGEHRLFIGMPRQTGGTQAKTHR